MSIQDMIDKIVERLKQTGLPILVEAFPDDPSKFKLLHPQGAALVAYGGSRYGAPGSLDRIVQERAVQFDITLLLRKLHGRDSAVTTLDAIRVALTGLRLSNRTDLFGQPQGARLRPANDRYIGHSGGVWRYLITVEATIPAVEVLPEAQAGVIAQVTLTDPQGDTLSTITPEEASE